jgi:4-aminobutyrate aminotransferase-like enzyme
MVGLTLDDGLDAPAVRDRCLDAGLVLNCPGPGMLRLLPPLTLTSDDAARGLAIIDSCLSN